MRSNSTRSILGVAFSIGTVAVCLFPARSSGADPQTDPVRGSASFYQALPECQRTTICQGTPSVANGQAFAGDGLIWQTDFSNARINLVDSNNGCAIVAQCPVPGGSPSENAFDGTFVHHYNFSTGLLYQIDPQDCQIVATCDPPGDDLAEGLTWDGEALWKGDSSTLYRISTPAQGCQVLGSCPNPAGTSADGLATCGGLNVMLGYDGALYQIDPATCDAVGVCNLNDGGQANGITSDNLPPFGSLFVDQPYIVEYDPEADVATLYMGLDEATIFTGTPNSNADIDALHATADGKVIFSIRSDGIGRVGNGPSYGFADAPRTDLFEIDPVTLDASLFLDGDGLFDGATRNLDAVSLSVPARGGGSEELARGSGCGLGHELVLLLPLLSLLGRRRRCPPPIAGQSFPPPLHR